MSVHYSQYGLNTYLGTPYFKSQIPTGYPLRETLEKCRAFRRLPNHLKELSALAKRWWAVHGTTDQASDISSWYDAQGNELDPDTGKPLTDAEIDADWAQWPVPTLQVKDIPIPKGGFADPDTWEEPLASADTERHHPSEEQLLNEMESHGVEATAKEYGLTVDQLPDYTAAKKHFSRRAAMVISSPYLAAHSEDRTFLAEALTGADIYDDLGGRALDIYDKAEHSLHAS